MSETGGGPTPDPDRPGAPGPGDQSSTPDQARPQDQPHAPPGGPDAGQFQQPDPPQPPPPMPPPPPQQQWNQPAWVNQGGYGKPGVIPLRPLTLGEILDGAITTMRRYPALVLGVSALVAVVNTALGYLLNLFSLDDLRRATESLQRTSDPQQQLDEVLPLLGNSLMISGIGLLITMLTTTFLTGFLTVVIGKAVLGRPVSFGGAFAEAGPRLLPLLGLTLLYTLIVAALPVVGGFAAVYASGVGVPLLLAGLVAAVWLYVRYSLASTALVLERGRISQALSRSQLLVKGSWWRVFGILLLALVINVVISELIALPFGAASGAFTGIFSGTVTVPTASDLLLTSLGGLIATTITAPFSAGVTALLYIDQRMRREGMDIELARAAGSAPQ
ncbi:hypothetical protein [Amycolatopsis nigrescens]|uniref:hypothetical protein n=1 Tax=Amycolatopsis nigrescens TaxID=381445 RepID=UPI0003AAD33B|nr:hypothetical protein [Amycolatopsis nigrescens]